MTRLPTLGPRGEGWVLAQGVLLLAIAAAGFSGPAWTDGLRAATTVLAGLVGLAGLVLAVGGIRDLGSNVTPLPRPKDDAQLVETGSYGLVRHPIYGGLVLGALAWGLLTAAPLAIAGAFVLLAFFDLKSRREEAWLVGRYPGYEAYRKRTRRLIPWLY
ncbi:MAG TPA: isoprenylcysteine carboxylmethyltransferase family protein [Candidatus Limnocylindrales bacterium]